MLQTFVGKNKGTVSCLLDNKTPLMTLLWSQKLVLSMIPSFKFTAFSSLLALFLAWTVAYILSIVTQNKTLWVPLHSFKYSVSTFVIYIHEDYRIRGGEKSSLLTIPSCSFFSFLSVKHLKRCSVYTHCLIFTSRQLINLPQSSSTQALWWKLFLCTKTLHLQYSILISSSEASDTVDYHLLDYSWHTIALDSS